jgi:peptidoglycan hydrolase CwlO-like protein
MMEKELEELRGKVSNMAESKETKDAENAEIKRQMEELSEQLSSVTETRYVLL